MLILSSLPAPKVQANYYFAKCMVSNINISCPLSFPNFKEVYSYMYVCQTVHQIKIYIKHYHVMEILHTVFELIRLEPWLPGQLMTTIYL